MTITIMNYANRRTEVEIGSLEDIRKIEILIITGDEWLVVHTVNNEVKLYKSDVAYTNFADGSYEIYNKDDGNMLMFSDRWINRADSYDYL